ncbi:MAG TPA: hypothetical protein VEC92_02450 [Nitrososphaerales archaeon]|nr:hypothetical protein [Nitrososphaerales archaeon]
MELKPAKGLKVRVEADREAIFGEEAVQIRRVTLPKDNGRNGVMTGTVIAGYCEVDMPSFDGKKHWYPVEGLVGENGEKIVEEEIELPEESDDSEGSMESEADEE